MITEEILTDKIYLPTLKKEILRPWFLPTEESLEDQRKLLSQSFFLLKQGTFGERLICNECGRRHDYITLRCIERPFSGLTGGIYAYYRTITDNKLEGELAPEERSRFDAVVATLQGMQDLGTVHPNLAKTLMRDTAAGDMRLGAIALGLLEGIAPIHAAKLVRRINDSGLRPKLVLEGCAA